MTRSFYALFAAVAITAMLTACADNSKPSTPRNRHGYSGTQTVQNSQQQSATNSSSLPPLSGTDTSTGITDSSLVNTSSSSSASSTSLPSTASTPTPAVISTPEISYGIPVPGKPGYVTSPHAPNAGFVDVRGFPPGTEVKDPYSGRIFLVP